MTRKAFVMSVLAGHEQAHAAQHNPMWPELASTLKGRGVHNYSIFLPPATRPLFAYVELESEETGADIGRTDSCGRGWKFIREVMPANAADNSVAREFRKAFHVP